MDSAAGGRAAGIVLVLLSSAGLGAATVFAKLAYEDGTGPITLLAFRYGIAAAVLLLPAVSSRRGGDDPLALPAFLAVSLLYVGSAASFWIAIKLGPVTDVAPIAYLYPAVVALIGFAVFGEPFGPLRVGAVVLAAAGSSLIFGVPSGRGDLLARALALLCAFTTAVYYVAAGRTVRAAQSLQGGAMLCVVGTAVFAPLIAATGFQPPDSRAGWAYVGAIAVIGTIVPLTLILAGVSRIGPTYASLLTLGEPVVAVVLALIVLGERLGAFQLAGIVLILGSLVLASLGRAGRQVGPPAEV